MSDDFFDVGGSDPFESGYTDPENTFNNGDTVVNFPAPEDGSFGNNGGSVGDNGASGGSGEEPGNAGTSGAPTKDDYDTLVKQFGASRAAAIMQQVIKDNPGWANTISKFLPPGSGGPGGGGGGPGGSGSPLGTTDPMGLAAAMALAYQQFHNADQYTKQADKYGKELNPYGAYRDAAAQKLAALQADPSSIVDTPGYKFNLSQGLGAVANRDNRSYGVGAGSTNPDMMNFASGLASKTYNDTIKQYSDQAGVGIGPSAAASIYGLGMQGNIASQNNAINALMSPFGPGNNTGGGGGGLGGFDWSKLFGGNVPDGLNLNQQPPGDDVVPYSAGGPPPPNGTTGVIPGGT